MFWIIVLVFKVRNLWYGKELPSEIVKSLSLKFYLPVPWLKLIGPHCINSVVPPFIFFCMQWSKIDVAIDSRSFSHFEISYTDFFVQPNRKSITYLRFLL